MNGQIGMNAILPQTANTICTGARSIGGTICGGIVEDGIEEWLSVKKDGLCAGMLVVEGSCASFEDTVPEIALSCDVGFMNVILPRRRAPECYGQSQ